MAVDTQRLKKLRIPGVEDNEWALGGPSMMKPQVITMTAPRTFRINAARAGTADAPEIDTNPDDIVEIELEDGTRLWTTQHRLCNELLPPSGRGEAGEVMELPARLPLHGPSRGFFGAALIKTLRFFRIDVPEFAARKLAHLWEKRTVDVDRGQGATLYRCASTAKFALTPWDERQGGRSSDPLLLLFLHGTASSTHGSFGALWTTEQRTLREQLFAPYRDNVFALEHRTLTESPVQNAIDLAKQLPAGAQLHLISHSRGGLVGELLCRAQMEGGRDPFDSDDLKFFHAHDPEGQRGDLEELNRLLKDKRLRVQRFVRVACPMRGTTLASGRLDIYLSVIFNLLQQVPVLQISPVGIVFDVLTELIMAIAKERSDPSVLPGIEAMIPSSPLTAVLNRPDCKVAGALRVIAGDIEGGGLGSALGTLLTDPLYLDDHDLVVNTEAMFGGAERKEGAAFSLHQGSHVSHFRYFHNEDSTSRLLQAMTRQEGEEDGFTPYVVRQTESDEPIYRREVGGPPQPVVFILPGMMGSCLAVGNDHVWLDIGALAFGGLARLAIDAQGVQPESPVWMTHRRLMKYLSNTYEVVPFPYDWRRSIEIEAARLASMIQRKLDEVERHNQSISILAHSMGGLVARAMIVLHPATWQRLCQHPDARLVMLGTPNRGSYIIPQVLTGRDRLIKKLALLDFKHSQKELLEIVCAYPGLLELLPSHGTHDLFSSATWARIENADAERSTWQKPSDHLLEAARRVHHRIEQSPIDATRMLYVAGYAPATPVDMDITKDDDDNERIVFYATPQGDGRVPWVTGRLPGVKTWYMKAVHGDLADSELDFPAIFDLLQQGTTDRLPTTVPDTRGTPDRFEMPVEKAPLFPDLEDLTRTALGSRKMSGKQRPGYKARVTVVHGNLGYASHPVMVGHYQGDTIISAEAHLDRVMDGRLRDRHQLGLYPGADDTAEVFLNPGKKPAGAIVIGLGDVGNLSPGGLTRAVSRGIRSYAIALVDSAAGQDTASPGRRAASISFLLVGTGAGGLSVEDAVAAILHGVAHAHQSLEETGYAERITIDEVEFIELYEDRAIQAARALTRVRRDAVLARRFEIDAKPQVTRLRGGRRRASFFVDDPWWQRMQIVEDKQGRLSFNLLTDRARAQVYLQPTQRRLVDQFILDAIQTTWDAPEIAVTLFEMLVPNDIKEHAPDQRDVVLVLNDGSARYPWELMQDRRAGDGNEANTGGKPLAIQAGMIRQLQALEFRDHIVMAKGWSALVVGDPPSQFVALPGAEAEAQEAAKLLQDGGFNVKALIRTDAKDILHALYARDYRIVHLAGHGVYNYYPNQKPLHAQSDAEHVGCGITGMVIGDNQFLTPVEIRQMRAVPELVFINCCHLGRVEDTAQRLHTDPPRLAANVATELIRMGVRAVVAAGWAVNDDAATTFASTFYREMLSGATFGWAVHSARRAAFDAYPTVNTWGAYQCYGDPSFTLSQGPVSGTPRLQKAHAVAPAEVLVELENIVEDATTAADTRIADLRIRVKDLVQHMPREWLHTGNMHAAIGFAFGELGLFEKAIKHYKAALKAEKALFPFRAVEQLCNLQARRAVQLAMANPKEAKECIDEARQRLDDLIRAVGPTVERLCLMGGIAKREAGMAPRLDDKRQALREMGQSYQEAYQLGVSENQQTDPYPLLNGLTAQILLSLTGKSPRKPANLKAHLQRAYDAAVAGDRRHPNFWDAASVTECQLLEHLANRDLAEHTGEIIAGYLEAKQRDGSPREFSSVQEQFGFLATVVAAVPHENLKAKLGDALAEIRRGLEM